MKIVDIKKIFAVSTLLLSTALSVTAQDLTSYFMPNAIASTSHNAAFAPNRGYFNIPFVGDMSLSTSGNLALSKIFTSLDGSLVPIIDTRVSASTALEGLNDTNNFGFENKIGILGFGSYREDGVTFVSFDLNLRTSANLSIPYSLIDFIKTAPEQASVGGVNLYAESYAEAALGFSRPVGKNLTVGARVKFLVGLANASLGIDNLDATFTSGLWAAQAAGSLNLNMAGISAEPTMNEDGEMVFGFEDIAGTPTGPAGYGGAIDLGATYKLGKRLTLSAAINDLGFISWNVKNNTRAQMSNQFDFTGADAVVGSEAVLDETSGSIEIEDFEFVQSESEGEVEMLQASINLGAEYSILHDRLSAGVVYSRRYWRTQSVDNLTLAASFTPLNFLTVAASYAFTNNNANALGLAANFSTGLLNIYVATDVLMSRMTAQYIPIDQSAMNLSVGLAFPLGRKSLRNAEE